ncbi:hypothetical protein FPCIR_2063 [Fusarium pseudocircinatum]|uniref:Uncharacterized protein n=1 Tax=Fusarium pseudocircinatum TaxID=56676 RepID=A0A8H5PS67_9HYPO|nr:hypothetical protein FPCIR_2063 [Fusarium pseudocircinatum]
MQRVGFDKEHPNSITEEMLDEDDDIPMSKEEEDRGEDTDHHISTDNPTIHVHGGKAAIEQMTQTDAKEGGICRWKQGEKE